MFQAKKLIKRCPNGTGATQRDVSPIDDASHPHQHHRNITSQKENKSIEKAEQAYKSIEKAEQAYKSVEKAEQAYKSIEKAEQANK